MMPESVPTFLLRVVRVTLEGATNRQVIKRMEASGLLEGGCIILVENQPHTVIIVLKEGIDETTAVTRMAQEIARRICS